MKLDKAIELSKEAEFSLRHHKFFDYADAVKLAREALDRLQSERLILNDPHWCPLPSETPQ